MANPVPAYVEDYNSDEGESLSIAPQKGANVAMKREHPSERLREDSRNVASTAPSNTDSGYSSIAQTRLRKIRKSGQLAQERANAIQEKDSPSSEEEMSETQSEDESDSGFVDYNDRALMPPPPPRRRPSILDTRPATESNRAERRKPPRRSLSNERIEKRYHTRERDRARDRPEIIVQIADRTIPRRRTSPPSRPQSYHGVGLPYSTRDHGPPQSYYPQSYYNMPPTYPRRTSRTHSRPSSTMSASSAGSVDSGFGEGDYDLSMHRRSSGASRPSSLTYSQYQPHGPPPAPSHYFDNYPTYPPRPPSSYYASPFDTPQSSNPQQPTSISVKYSPAFVSSISPAGQSWTMRVNLPYPAQNRIDLFKDQDRDLCLKLFTDADRNNEKAVNMFELQTMNTDRLSFQASTIDRLVRLFAARDLARVRHPALNFDQFRILWISLREWTLAFEKHVIGKDGRIPYEELHKVFDTLGYPGPIVKYLVPKSLENNSRFTRKFRPDLEAFVNLCIALQNITELYQSRILEGAESTGLSFEGYVSDMILFYNEMSLGETFYRRSADPRKPTVIEAVTPPPVTHTAPPPGPLSPVPEVIPSAEAIPQIKDFEEETESQAEERRPAGKPIVHVWEQDLTLSNWKELLPILPEEFRDQLELREVFGSGLVWTCTPSDSTQSGKIPLTIAGRPVVIPVAFRYPVMSATTPPPDPHPHFINPSTSIDEFTMNDIFSTFEDALGFYLLVNGMLQLVVPEGFDYQYGVSHRPNEFGGLRVSYVTQDMIPTAEALAESSNSTVTVQPASPIKSHHHPSISGSSKTASSQPPTLGGNPTRLEIGSLVQAKVEKSKATERFQGKVGVMTTTEDGHFLVVSSHVLTQALTAAKHDSFPGNDWAKNVTILSGNGGKEIGKISETFDPNARSFPHGFHHDVSLVDVTYAPMHLVAGIRSPLPATWLDQAGWSNIKYTTKTLYLLDSPNIQSKSIGILGSQCQMVGQGIFRIQSQLEKKTRFKFSFGHKRSNSGSAASVPETWTSLVSRSVLYRVDPDYRSPGAQSGTAVCVHEETEDRVETVKIAGFSSFVQQVSDVQRFEMEGEKFYKRLEEGRVAFYGALQAPEKLRNEHSIA